MKNMPKIKLNLAKSGAPAIPAGSLCVSYLWRRRRSGQEHDSAQSGPGEVTGMTHAATCLSAGTAQQTLGQKKTRTFQLSAQLRFQRLLSLLLFWGASHRTNPETLGSVESLGIRPV